MASTPNESESVDDLIAKLLAILPTRKPYLLVKDLARQLHVSPATVRSWIDNGELKASNVARPGERRSFRIRQSAVDEFLRTREIEPAAPKRTKTRGATDPAVIEFF